MDKPRLFTPEDLPEIDSWFESRGSSPIPLRFLPKIGFIVPGIAAGFLYQTDSAVGWIENLISSKDTSAEERDEALDAIVQAVLSHAKSVGMECVVGFTTLSRVTERAERLGFRSSPQTYTFLSRGMN